LDFALLSCRYRAPECLLTDGYYNYKMDMWGVGCVMFEVVALYPLFPGVRAGRAGSTSLM
jgi:serine/threonine protein kinase